MWLAAVSAAAPGRPPSALAADATAAGAEGSALDARIIWQYWSQGQKHLQQLSRHANDTWDKYSMTWRCSNYWKRLNPTYEHRLLDDDSAAELSPAFAALVGRHLDLALMADVLRLDLLSRYGGVWADVTTCPVQPLESYVADKTAAVGFFALMWEPFYTRQTSGNHTPGALDGFDKDAPCVHRRKVDTQGYHTIDNWFLLSPKPHNPIIDTWLDALIGVVHSLPDHAIPCRPKHCAVMGDYVYHLPMCVLGQLYADNATMRTMLDAMPAASLCQHADNASPRCSKVLESGEPEDAFDTKLDPAKLMYKSLSSSGIREEEYDEWIADSHPVR